MKRIYGIGLSRTGTTSLTHAMYHLGIDMIHYPSYTQLFDPKTKAASDIPVALYYKELDNKFPGSLFIHTVRDKDSWLRSMESHFTKHQPTKISKYFSDNRKLVYGSQEYNKDMFATAYDKHMDDVKDYFANRSDYLKMYICDGEGWNALLPFLGIDSKTITAPFPHKRKTQ